VDDNKKCAKITNNSNLYETKAGIVKLLFWLQSENDTVKAVS